MKFKSSNIILAFSCLLQLNVNAFQVNPTGNSVYHRLSSSSYLTTTQQPSTSLKHHGKTLFRTSLYSKLESKSVLGEKISTIIVPPSAGSETEDDIKASVTTPFTEDDVPTVTAIESISSFVKEKILLGIEPKPEIIAIMTIYFVEGALGLARLAQTFLLKDQLHLGPAELSALTGLFTLPWTIKPLYGFLSDGFPLFGYRRRSYLVIAGLLGGFTYTALGANFWGLFADPVTTTTAVEAAVATTTATGGGFFSSISLIQGSVAALILSSACIAFSDVVADGIVVQRTRDSDDEKVAGGLQSLCWGSAALGGLLSAYFSGSLIESIGPQGVFQITAALPLAVAAIALLIDEKPVTGSSSSSNEEQESTNLTGSMAVVEKVDSVQEQVKALGSAIKNPGVWKPALFLFLWQSTPTGEGAFLYFMTDDLGFGPEFLGRVRLVTAAAGLVGVWIYQKYLRTVSIKSILFWSSIASTPLGLSQLLLISHTNRSLGIPDAAFVFGDDVALSILGQIAFLPTLVLAARICPPGVEAVLFATLMSIFNGASTIGTEVGALLTKYLGVTEDNFDNLGLLTLICNISSLYPLLFIGLLDEVGDKSEAVMEGEEGDIVLEVSGLNGKE